MKTRPTPRRLRRGSRLLSTLVLMAHSASAAPSEARRIPEPPQALREQLSAFELGSSEPVSVIVKLASEPVAAHAAAYKNRGQAIAEGARRAQREKVRGERGRIIGELARLGLKGGPRHVYEEALNGFALRVPADQLALIASLPGVVGIYPDAEVVREQGLKEDTDAPAPAPELTESVPAIGAPALWARGYRGEGMLVAILDDGVDYTHPDLGGCLGAGCKVQGGYDFVDLDADPQEAPEDYHGTHVAATAAGLKGVAPGAKLLAIRVLGTSTSGKSSNLSAVMAGLDYAVAQGADVANMSLGLGTTYAQANNLWGEMVANAVRAGVVVTNSNGNNGPGTYTTGVYAATPDTIGVGNSDARAARYPRTTLAATGEALLGGSYGTSFPASLLGTHLQVVDVGYGNAPSDYAGKSVVGKLVIAQRGGTGDVSFVNKANQAAAAGAAGILLYNDAARATDFTTAALGLPSFTLSYANGRKVLANPLVVVNDFNPGPQMNSGSSRGPTPDLLMKPDVSAPGTAIVAAVPFAISATGYASLSGTSMASPHIAGSAALLRQAHPEWTPLQVKTALMNTAGNLATLTGDSYRTIEQGSGFVDLSRALAPAVSIAPGSLSFGMLTPEGGYSATRTLTVTPRAAGRGYQVRAELLKSWPGVTAASSVTQVSTDGSAVEVGLSVSVDPAVAAAGEYEGYLRFTNTEDPSDSYRVPFFFVHRLPVSELRLADLFIGTQANGRESVDVSFKVGQPLADWYLGSMAGTRYTANQGPAQPGSRTYRWNGRTSAGLLLAEGNWNMGVWYRLPGTTTFTFGTTYTRFFVDRTAPLLAIDAPAPGVVSNPRLALTGAVADSGMYTWGDVGGRVDINGQPADLFLRAPALSFPEQNSELAFGHELTLREGMNTVTLYAEDRSGNRSAVTYTYELRLDTRGPVTVATASPGPNGFGWNNGSVTVGLAATDTDGSGVSGLDYGLAGAPLVSVAGASAQVRLESEGIQTLEFRAVDQAGNVEPTKSLGVRIDRTAPALGVSGEGSYTVEQTVAVSCTAADALSGLDLDPCGAPVVSEAAWNLPLGTSTFPLLASDRAGNVTSRQVSVTVRATFDSLRALTSRLLEGAAPGQANSLGAKLDAAKSASERGNTTAANHQLAAYRHQVEAQSGKALTAEQAATLSRLAEALTH
ncbi:S8 family serine peptidase [Archangium violaceum]|uniref:S8 family serine peptidase n=1 Tax=Archangium violaceum TaxID=83451 RepID=UPI001952563E|nr:S8 family serine peptidase [Archangium violaceum]QRN98638.1 S8 family serine peptidase [Archangium violaceum]